MIILLKCVDRLSPIQEKRLETQAKFPSKLGIIFLWYLNFEKTSKKLLYPIKDHHRFNKGFYITLIVVKMGRDADLAILNRQLQLAINKCIRDI